MNALPPVLKHTAAALALSAAAHGTVTTFAEYHLGEAGSLAATSNTPQDSSGNGIHFATAISGPLAVVESADVAAPGSTACLDTTAVNNIGWYGANFGTLPTDDFAFGVFARSSTLQAGRTIFTLGNATGRFKLHAGTSGWGASAHGVAWIGPTQGVAGSFTPDTWVHVAVIRSAGISTLYLNGTAQPGTPATVPVHSASGHMAVASGGAATGYFNGQIDEARVVTFTADETAAAILTALQGGQWPPRPPAFVNVGPAATWDTVELSTDEVSVFRIGGVSDDFATVTGVDGLSVSGTAPKHLITIDAQGDLAAGAYPLISYAGTIGGLGFAGLELGPMGRYEASLVNNTADGTIDLLITGGTPADLVWTAAAGTTWDLETTASWKLVAGGAATTFFMGDKVLFDVTAAGTSPLAVTLSGTMTPGAVTIDNTAKDYVFDGDGITGPAILEKFGTGTLTINNSNTYTGSTYIEDGTVRIGPGGALGTGGILSFGSLVFENTDTLTVPDIITGDGTLEKSGSGDLLLTGNSSFAGEVIHRSGILRSGNNNCLGSTLGITTVQDGATLDVNGIGFGAEPITITGAGVGGAGVIVNSGAPDTTGVVALTLAGDASIGGTNRWDVRGATSLVEGDFTLTKVGVNQISCVDADVTVRNIVVTEGNFGIEVGSIVDDTYPGTITATGGFLSFGDFGTPVTCEKPIVLDGGIMRGVNTGAAVLSPVTLAGDTNEIFTDLGAILYLDGDVSGGGSLRKTGSGTLILTGAPAYAGNTAVDDGSLVLDFPGLADTSLVSIGTTAILELNFDGPDTVDALSIGGIGQPAGSYDANHPSGRFVGTGTLVVTSDTGRSYDSWASGFAGLTDPSPALDFESDGLQTGIEYVVGGDPTANDGATIAPTFTNTGSAFEYAFRRTVLANADPATTITVQYGSDLIGWTTAEDGVGGISITVTDGFHGPDIDQVVVRLPGALAMDGILFARMHVTIE